MAIASKAFLGLPARPRPIRTPAWVYCGTFGLLYRIQVRVIGAGPFAMRRPALLAHCEISDPGQHVLPDRGMGEALT